MRDAGTPAGSVVYPDSHWEHRWPGASCPLPPGQRQDRLRALPRTGAAVTGLASARVILNHFLLAPHSSHPAQCLALQATEVFLYVGPREIAKSLLPHWEQSLKVSNQPRVVDFSSPTVLGKWYLSQLDNIYDM